MNEDEYVFGTLSVLPIFVYSLLNFLCSLNQQDIGLSKDLNDEFKNYMREKQDVLPLDFQIQVLSSGSWPFTQCVEFALPSEVIFIC